MSRRLCQLQIGGAGRNFGLRRAYFSWSAEWAPAVHVATSSAEHRSGEPKSGRGSS